MLSSFVTNYCDYCHERIDSLVPYRCHYCGKYHCDNHRFPESHLCKGTTKDGWITWRKEQQKLQGIKARRSSPKPEPVIIKVNPEVNYPQRKQRIDTNNGTHSLFIKCRECSFESLEMFQCQYCGNWYCYDHREPKEKLNKLHTSMGHSCAEFRSSQPLRNSTFEKIKITSTENILESSQRPRKPLYENDNKIVKWFFWKKHPRSHLRLKPFIVSFVSMIVLFLLMIIFLDNGSPNPTLGFFRLGSIFFIVLLILFFYFLYKFLVNTKYGIRGLANGFKTITCLICLIFIVQILIQPNIIIVPFAQFNVNTLNPFQLNSSGSSDLSIIPKPQINIPQLEAEIHDLINSQRQQNGVPPLNYDIALSAIARSHSQDMVNRGYFDHVNPEGDGPTQRALKAGYPVHKELGGGWYSDGIAENIFQNNLWDTVTYYNGIPFYDWKSQSEIASSTVYGWMNSPGHRQNILDSSYNNEGLGVSISSDDKVYITEDFW